MLIRVHKAFEEDSTSSREFFESSLYGISR